MEQTITKYYLKPIPGVSINFKTWVFYKGWFPRFGFFISRPYTIFVYNDDSFFYKSAHFIHFNYFWSQNSDFVMLYVILAFGPWVGLGLRRLSTSSDLSFLSNWLSFLWICWKLEHFNSRDPNGKMSNRDPWPILSIPASLFPAERFSHMLLS